MIQRHSFVKRRLKGIAPVIFFSFLIFLFSFAVLFGIWVFFTIHRTLLTPLPKLIAQGKESSLTNMITSLCQQNKISCTGITINTDTASFFVNTDEQVLLSLKKDIPMQIASLQLTIMHLTIEGKRFHRLDFRFDKPVISY